MKNLLNLRWLHGSPNQTGETLTRENRLGIVTCLNPMRTLLITLLLLTLGTGQMWADTYSIALSSEDFNTNNHKMTGEGALTISLAANTTYEFKVVWNNGSDHWLGMGSADDRTFVVNSISEWGCTWDGGENIILNTAEAGDYVFTFAITGNKLSVTYPSVTHPSTGYVYLSNTWSNGYVHLWSSTSSTASTKWPGPGLPTTIIGGSSYYYCAAGDYEKLIFNNNDGSQTSELAPSHGKYARWSTSWGWGTFQYTVTLDNQSATSAGTTSVTAHFNTNTNLSSNITCPTKTGYNFGGYYTEKAGAGSMLINSSGEWQSNVSGYTAASKTWIKNSAITLYAKWTQTVTLNANTANHGSGENGSATATWNGTALSGISHPSGATGYTCTGYFTAATDGTKVLNANGTYAGSDITGYITGEKWSRTSTTTLYAQWDNHYTVTLDNQGANSVGTEEVTATYGSAMPAITVPKKNGYTFGGYYTETNGEGTQYYDKYGASARTWNIDSNTTLYAKWTGVSYHVEFNANGGTGTMSNQDLDYGTETALNTNTFTRDGYYFLGWNTNADGSGTAFYDGKSVSTLSPREGTTVTLYAQWAKMHTLYFLNMGVSGWNNVSGNQASTVRYAYAFISYDGHEMYPLGTYSANSSQGTRMTAESAITLTNVNNGESTWCWSIDGVPEGATILFSDNTDGHKSGYQSGWTADKPYFCNGNSTWYALDEGETNRISAMTDMSVYFSKGGSSWTYYALYKHDNGTTYAIINLESGVTNYQYTYYNWRTKTHSKQTGNSYIINGSETKVDHVGAWTLNGSAYNVNINTTTHATGEYKFLLTWSDGNPQTTVYIPRGVNLTTTSPVEAKAGESVTVSLTADAWTNLSSGTDMDNPIYTFQFSTDNSNWTDIAVVSPESSKMQATTDYTFAARSGYFRVKLVNDHGLASYSGSTAFTAYSTKSFYVYNPYNTDDDKWRWLHLYTWDSNNGNREYNGSLGSCYIHCTDAAGTHGTGCQHGNDIVAMGNNWFYVTIDERANKFLIAGENNNDSYASHKTVDCTVSNYIQDGKYMIETVSTTNYVNAYKAKGASDFRLKYTGAGGTRYSDIYNTTLDGTEVMASMWMNTADGTATLTIEKGTGSDTWGNAKVYSNSELKTLIPDTKEDHGYVFQMKVNFNTGTPASSTITEVAEYTGPFYVRTDVLEGGWNDYKRADHHMTNSEASLSGTPAYNYYLCKWVSSAGGNVKFTVANNYNKELVASLEGDLSSTDPLYGSQTVPTATNVRFAWNSQTNTLTRAYISGATDASDRFLVLAETGTTGRIYNKRGIPLTTAAGGAVVGLNEHELIFADNGNWVYELIMQANPGAQADVTAKYNGKEQKFIDNMTLIADGGSPKYTYRITYDFKTNILINAWVPDGQVNEDIDLNSNVMLIRNGQDAAQELTFGAKGGGHYSITNAKKLISVMQFDYDNMVGRMSTWNSQAYQYCMYYISFPFDVNVSDIFGIGTYGTDWKLQYYDGAERASKGFFRGDGTTTFWKDVPANGKLDKYVGYSLLLNRIKFNDGSSDIWENKAAGSSVYLYFPSTADAGTLQHDDYVLKVPAHECTLPQSWTDERGTHYHSVTDSHWNMIGVPILANSTVGGGLQSILGTEGDFRYLYAWNYGDNSLSVADATTSFTFQAMKAYMVQYCGSITFTGAGIPTPSSVAARRTAETRNLNIELQVLNADEQEINHTYVKMQEGADADFRLNEDLCMVTNSRAVNIYTYAGSYDVAANVLPLETTTVPVGVMVKTAGSYTFSMPSDFSGTVTLVDTYAQTRTNLGIEDYTVNLEEGTFNSRFLLELNTHQAPTAIDGVSDGTLKDGKAHKFLQNGVMYILQNGVMYDAQGKRVK